jgi:hypothetical protein
LNTFAGDVSVIVTGSGPLRLAGDTYRNPKKSNHKKQSKKENTK